MKRLVLFAASIACILSLGACTYDDSKVWDSINDLKDRVERLEQIAEDFQKDLDALSSVVDKLSQGISVVSVEENPDGGYTIVFSDGSRITISDGVDGVTPPSVTIVKEGDCYYWAFRNPDGSIEFILDDQGNKIPVTGQAPQIRINPQTENWEISTDGGKTWTDTGVCASGGDGSLLSDVREDEYHFYITLSDGTEIVLPKYIELSFVFDAQGLQKFTPGQTRTFTFTATGGEKTSVSKPDGWRVTMGEGSMEITAPVAENTFAETEGLVSVILFAPNGACCAAELEVAVGPAPPKIGDYYYADGTWSDGGLISIELDGLNAVWAEQKPAPLEGKQVIGIVCQTFPERIAASDREAGYVNGYVMALKAAHGTQKNTTAWSLDYGFDCLKGAKNSDTWYNNVNGYVETMTVRDNYGQNIAQCPAFDWTLNDFPLPAPEGTSGWFLPSTGQLWDMVANFCGAEVAAVMKPWSTQSLNAEWGYAAGEVEYDIIARFNQVMSMIPQEQKEEIFVSTSEYYSQAYLWASTPCTPGETAAVIALGSKGNIELYCEYTDGDCIARPILAF